MVLDIHIRANCVRGDSLWRGVATWKTVPKYEVMIKASLVHSSYKPLPD